MNKVNANENWVCKHGVTHNPKTNVFCKTCLKDSMRGGEDMSDTFRKEYTPLDEQQKAEMLAIKDKAEELEALFIKSMQREPRLMSLAKTHLENSVMWAVKAVTTASMGGENPQA